MPLTHLDRDGRARMVDVSAKPSTVRSATASGTVFLKPSTLRLIRTGRIGKGDVLAVAQAAGIMGAKQTPGLIPLCHPISLTGVEMVFKGSPRAAGGGRSRLTITATVKTVGPTGAEMEALTAVCAAALTIYDMCKSVDREMRFGEIMLTAKSGGRSGTFRRAPSRKG